MTSTNEQHEGPIRQLMLCAQIKEDTAALTNLTISHKQQLYLTDPVTPGSIFFLPHGTRLINKLVSFMKHQQLKHGFHEVITPLIYKKQLWEQSGHWDNYKDDMFKVEGTDIEKELYGLKPMNCPGHCLVFKKIDRSVGELPLRFSDFSSLHRNEASGALSGLTRVRRFHQDDGHIFCTGEQVKAEIDNTLTLINTVYRTFDLNEYRLLLSTRPEKYIGSVEEWNLAESNLKEVLETTGREWSINEGDGAFYGPKIDVLLKDHTGKEHQVATIQLDFQLPARFELKYKSSSNSMERPIMIHRAVFGSLERFLAILIDHYDGKWPFWMNPRQAIVIPVSLDKHGAFAEQVAAQLRGDIVDGNINTAAPLTGHHFHVDVDTRNETVGSRTKDAIAKSYSYIVMVGDKEVESQTISMRSRSSRKITSMTVDEAARTFVELEKKYE
ncbi:hypothetical protein BABINDRAFT_180495 [Babjeviella inositovora NRRL Y-12698]|uniref:threonine--tRNA ligase n=1 Tax=Babjeviella inositovora NRRL Y-12698 TaxID=984486 RepID=A0A1E3QNQ8_9ASCO|nr:uncharacterized protein BABINDRAFT_180495 [Babjeviella inositovora NRRL Y-12698]ODQ79311.1 hypothetical protein BABINDRAFT_180495 [Babjeviella inositovora NRRL Y-12698]